jgi:signal peptidase II
VAVAILALDRVTKVWIEGNLDIGQTVDVIGTLLQLWRVENSGAAFSFLQGGRLFFLVVSLGAVAVIAWSHWRMRGQGWIIQAVLGLFLAGALGNFVDRVIDGSVTDWISVGIGALRFPTFNVADAALTVGVLAFLGLTLLGNRASEKVT